MQTASLWIFLLMAPVASSCMRTVSSEGAVLPANVKTAREPLRREERDDEKEGEKEDGGGFRREIMQRRRAVAEKEEEQNDEKTIERHRELFRSALRARQRIGGETGRRAKTFRVVQSREERRETTKTEMTRETEGDGETQTEKEEENRVKEAETQTEKKGEKRVKEAETQTEKKGEKRVKEAETQTARAGKDGMDLFEALSVDKPDMCGNCPSLLLPTNGGLEKSCENWKELEENFEMEMDKKRPIMEDEVDIRRCRRNVTCTQPHVIIKWFDFSMCDVQSLEDSTVFSYSCNGTHWNMRGFPIEAVSCAVKTKKKKESRRRGREEEGRVDGE